jgi:hypothetical protein
MKIKVAFFLLATVAALAEQPAREKVIFEYRALPHSITDVGALKQSVTLRLRGDLIFGEAWSQGELVSNFGGNAAFTERITRVLRDAKIPNLDWTAHLLAVKQKNDRMLATLHARTFIVYLDAFGSACSFQMLEPAHDIQQLAQEDELVRRLDRVFEAIDAELGSVRLHFFRWDNPKHSASPQPTPDTL